MADNGKFYWIKLKTDFFNQETIDFLMSQPNGCQYVVLYQMICLSTANNNGCLSTTIGEMIIPYSIDKIVRDTKYFDFDTVTIALELFKKLGLVYVQEDSILRIADIHAMVGSESNSREAIKKRNQRVKKLEKGQQGDKEGDKLSPQTGDTKGTNCPTEIRDKRLEIRDKSLDNTDTFINKTNIHKKNTLSANADEKKKNGYEKVVDLFNSTCTALPKVKSLTDARKRAIKKATEKLETLEEFEKLFKLVQDSDFLTGRSEKGWDGCCFDWIMKPSNLVKILEGNYSNKNKQVAQNGAEDEHQQRSYDIEEWEKFSFFD